MGKKGKNSLKYAYILCVNYTFKLFFILIIEEFIFWLCNLWELSYLTRDSTGAMAVKAENPNHQATRGLTYLLFTYTCFHCLMNILFCL